MKKITLFALIFCLLISFAGCTNEDSEGNTPKASDALPSDTVPAEKAEVNLAVLKGPTGMGAAYMMSQNDNDACANDYNITLAGAPDEISAGLIKGTIDIAAVPLNLAAVLYNKSKGAIECVAVNTLGVLYMLENGNTISSVSDLKGKTVYTSGQGSTPEFVLRHILLENGINPDTDLKIVYLSEHSEVTAALVSGKASIVLLPEPQVTVALTKNENFRIALDFNKEWKSITGIDLVQGCIVAQKSFLENKYDAFAAFLAEYSASVNYTLSDSDSAAEIIAGYGIIPSAALAKTAIPNCNIVFITGDEMEETVKKSLDVLFNAESSSVGGAMPADDFYYNS